MKRTWSPMLAALLVLAMLVPMSAIAEDVTFPVENIEFTYWYPMWEDETRFVGNGDMGDLHMYQQLEQDTGVKIAWIHPPVAENKTAFNVMLAQKDLPDIITQEYYVDYPGGPDKAIADGVYLRLNELMEAYAPEYWALINEDPEIRSQTRTDEGNVWCFYMIDSFAQPSYYGPVYRKDWLDKLGLEVPTTIDEYHDMLVAFKDEMGADVPLYMSYEGFFRNSKMLMSAFDVSHEFFVSDGVIRYGPVEDGFRDYLAMMKQWLDEGLIDGEFATRTQSGAYEAYVTNNRTGAWEDAHFTWQGLLAKATDPDMELISGPYLKLTPDQTIHFRQQNYRAQQNATAITTACENPEIAVAWLNMKFTEQYRIWGNYGIEGLTYEMVDGQPRFTEYAYSNPDGLSLNQVLYKYCFGKGPYYRIMGRNWFTFLPEGVAAMTIWYESSDGAAMLSPYMSMTPEDGEEYAIIMSDIETYVKESAVAFITGELSLDKWEDYVRTIESMGLDQALSIKQASYESFLKR